MPQEPLALMLLRASRWFDRQLLDGLQAAGWPRLSPAQSLLFAHLDSQGVPPAALARRLGTSRQGAQELVAGLVRHDLLAVQADPARRGGRLVVLTDRGRALTADARQLLDTLERSLGQRRAEQLRGLLADLGPADPGPADPGPAAPSPDEPPHAQAASAAAWSPTPSAQEKKAEGQVREDLARASLSRGQARVGMRAALADRARQTEVESA